MNTIRNPESLQKTEKSKIVFIGIVIVILAVLNGILWFEYNSTKEHLAETQQIKADLEKELSEAKVQFKEYEGKVSELDDLVKSLSGDLDKKAHFIEELLKDKKIAQSQIDKARKELSLLKEAKVKYLAQIDSLYKENQALYAKNVILQTDLDDASERNQSLTSENIQLANKVAVGSVLRTTNISSAGVRIKGTKERISTKAKSTEKIRVCFTVLENKIVSKGIKDFFVRILGPTGTVLSHNADPNETFIAEGMPTIFTIKEQLDYNNEEQDVCFYWDKGSEYNKGEYLIQIYESSYLIGKSNFVLE